MIEITPVGAHNWRAVASLEVAPSQRDFVMSPTYYLALCAYDDIGWRPLAIKVDGIVVGFLMWAVDPDDGSCWLGGIMIDCKHQGRGYGRQAIELALDRLSERQAFTEFALSYNPRNAVARRLYASLGFVDTDRWEGSEVVARHRRESWRRRGPRDAATLPSGAPRGRDTSSRGGSVARP